jgi:hypothetical protein
VWRCTVAAARVYTRFVIWSIGWPADWRDLGCVEGPNDVAISGFGAFASHLESFWREVLILTFAATLTALCCDYVRKRRVNVRLRRC